ATADVRAVPGPQVLRARVAAGTSTGRSRHPVGRARCGRVCQRYAAGARPAAWAAPGPRQPALGRRSEDQRWDRFRHDDQPPRRPAQPPALAARTASRTPRILQGGLMDAYSSGVELPPAAMAGGDYGLHQSLWQLFSDGPDRERDFLFHQRSERPSTCFVVSRRPPQPVAGWTFDTREYRPQLLPGQRLAFALRANPT